MPRERDPALPFRGRGVSVRIGRRRTSPGRSNGEYPHMHRKLIAALTLATVFVGGTAMAEATAGSTDYGHSHDRRHAHDSFHPMTHFGSHRHGHGHDDARHNHHPTGRRIHRPY